MIHTDHRVEMAVGDLVASLVALFVFLDCQTSTVFGDFSREGCFGHPNSGVQAGKELARRDFFVEGRQVSRIVPPFGVEQGTTAGRARAMRAPDRCP